MKEKYNGDKIKNLVYNFKTKYGDRGYTSGELEDLIIQIQKEHPTFSIVHFEDAMFGNTCALIDDKIVNYKHDVLTGIRCGLESRGQTFAEFD